jgi:hypothetical protein
VAASPRRIEQLFVVRLWRETGATSRGWRGSVEHIGTERRFFFSSLADLVEFIRVRIGGGSEHEHV